MTKILLLLACTGWLGNLLAQSGAVPEEKTERFIIEDSVLIKTNSGHLLSAVVVRPRSDTMPLPVALLYFMYSNTARSISEASDAAEHGYAGVVVDVRGKRLSADEVAPYENEAEDVYQAIDWISKQKWCNGKVGMYGGSYSGFAQWASLKYKVHPALKTIVPSVSAIPGMGLPMENNVFLNANYGWAFYVTNNKYLDTLVYYNNQRWQDLMDNWYQSGAPYNRIDSIDQAPNKWLQRWLQHPSFDEYWQRTIPYGKEYAKISIPVLAFDGYYDDGQLSGLYFIRELVKHQPAADYYVVLGPYDHFGAQRGGAAELRGYSVDSLALINVRNITFQWFDYIMKGGAKPPVLKDRINYEVMGANRWEHAGSFEDMYSHRKKYYLSGLKPGSNYLLSAVKPGKRSYLEQVVDLADRKTSNNFSYPYPIIQTGIATNGFTFSTEPFEVPMMMNGAFSGQLDLSINKKDLDFSVVLYELTPEGVYFELGYYLGRASYAHDMTQRHLLIPGKITAIPFDKTKIISRQLRKGSRLVISVNVNKSRFAQVNYGTGKDVSKEGMADAGKPLKVKWYNSSWVSIPLMENRSGR